MGRLIVFNIDTSSWKIGWSLPYHFNTRLNLWGLLYYVRVITHIWLELCMTKTYWFHIYSTISRPRLESSCFLCSSSWKHPDRARNGINVYCPNYHIICIIYCCNSVPKIIWRLVYDTLWHLVAKTRIATNIFWRWCLFILYLSNKFPSSVFSILP